MKCQALLFAAALAAALPAPEAAPNPLPAAPFNGELAARNPEAAPVAKATELEEKKKRSDMQRRRRRGNVNARSPTANPDDTSSPSDTSASSSDDLHKRATGMKLSKTKKRDIIMGKRSKTEKREASPWIEERSDTSSATSCSDSSADEANCYAKRSLKKAKAKKTRRDLAEKKEKRDLTPDIIDDNPSCSSSSDWDYDAVCRNGKKVKRDLARDGPPTKTRRDVAEKKSKARRDLTPDIIDDNPSCSSSSDWDYDAVCRNGKKQKRDLARDGPPVPRVKKTRRDLAERKAKRDLKPDIFESSPSCSSPSDWDYEYVCLGGQKMKREIGSEGPFMNKRETLDDALLRFRKREWDPYPE